MLNRLIKAAKRWNCEQANAAGDEPLRSFHLEAMAYRAQARAEQLRDDTQAIRAWGSLLGSSFAG